MTTPQLDPVAELKAILARAPVTPAESARIRELIWGKTSPDKSEMYWVFNQSEHWQKFKAEVLSDLGDHCEGCLYGEYAAIHHFTYTRIGAESIHDVAVYCKECHREAHRGEANAAKLRARLVLVRQVKGIPLLTLSDDDPGWSHVASED